MNKRVTLALLIIAGVAIIFRSAFLDRRPMHNDEAVNAVKFGQLYQHGTYKYDPEEYHGPTLEYTTLAFERLTGAPDFAHISEARLRWLTALFGVGVILLLPLLHDGLGRAAIVWAAVFTAISPAMVFYSRYYIHEMLLVFFTFLALASGWRYWRTRKLGWALLCGAAIGLMAATKETFIITLACAAFAVAANQTWNRLLDASGLPVKAERLNLLHLAAGMGVLLVVAILLFSSFLANANGPLDAIRTYQHWFSRAGGHSPHRYPWNFYLHRLLFYHAAKGPVWSEGFILALAIVGAAAGFLRKGLGETNASLVRFLAFYSLALLAVYSVISYKTPWCLLSFWHGFILLAGVGAAVLLRIARFQWASFAGGLLLAAGAAQLAAQAWQASVPHAADRGNPYVFSQTSTGLLELVQKVEALAKVSPQGHDMVIKVMAPEDDYWPLPWYLRAFKNVGFFREVPPDPDAPVMIVSARFGAALDDKKTHVMNSYFELRPQVLFELYVRLDLWSAYLEKNPPKTKTEPE